MTTASVMEVGWLKHLTRRNWRTARSRRFAASQARSAVPEHERSDSAPTDPVGNKALWRRYLKRPGTCDASRPSPYEKIAT